MPFFGTDFPSLPRYSLQVPPHRQPYTRPTLPFPDYSHSSKPSYPQAPGGGAPGVDANAVVIAPSPDGNAINASFSPLNVTVPNAHAHANQPNNNTTTPTIPPSSWSHLTAYSGPAKFLPLLAGTTSRVEAMEVSCVEPGYWDVWVGEGTGISTSSNGGPGSWGTVNSFISSFQNGGSVQGRGLDLPSLRSLSFVFDQLEEGMSEDLMEVLGTLAERCDGLEELRVRWVRGNGISEATLLSLVVHLYRVKPINIDLTKQEGFGEYIYDLDDDDFPEVANTPHLLIPTPDEHHRHLRQHGLVWKFVASTVAPEATTPTESTSTSSVNGSAPPADSADVDAPRRKDKRKGKAEERESESESEPRKNKAKEHDPEDRDKSLLQPQPECGHQWTISSTDPADWEYDATWTLSGRLGLLGPAAGVLSSPGASGSRGAGAGSVGGGSGTGSGGRGWGLRGPGDIVTKIKLEEWRRAQSTNAQTRATYQALTERMNRMSGTLDGDVMSNG
ncbi:hypothetical protein D9758_017196 [Tetrapyrgos nigripes]|uniref:Uncharacterized protein n=1 Tax=Tetrapyrgos nigripes TaxID=182062 RepID=A0A8H5C0H2_9AGAR|nr:hypothetical protein D9758_017196 [Tetrapyrgos nigripes]